MTARNVNEPKLVMLECKKVLCDPACMPRARMDMDHVKDLAEVLNRGVDLPPIQVFFDGEHRRVADGWHTLKAHMQAGRSHIAALVRPGSQKEARLHAAAANRQHTALKRSLDDRRRSVLLVLEDDEANRWPVAKIATWCDVSPGMVNGLVKAKEAREEQARRRQEEGEEAEMPPGLETLPEGPAGEEEASEEEASAEEDVVAPAADPPATAATAKGHTASNAAPPLHEDPAMALVLADADEDEEDDKADLDERRNRAVSKFARFCWAEGFEPEEGLKRWRASGLAARVREAWEGGGRGKRRKAEE